MRGKVLSRILRTVLQIRDSRDYRRGNGLPDRTHHAIAGEITERPDKVLKQGFAVR